MQEQDRQKKLLRNPQGEKLVGFPLDFLQSSLKTTLKFPQTQAVISIAVALTILRAHQDGRLNQIKALADDLAESSDRFINIPAISDFVSGHYQKIGMGKIKVPDEKYQSQFNFQIRCALASIAGITHNHFQELSPEEARLAVAIREETDSKGIALNTVIKRAVDCLVNFSPGFIEQLSDIYTESLCKIQQSQKAKNLYKFLMEGLPKTPKADWRLELIFPYGSGITKIADWTLYGVAKEKAEELSAGKPN